MKDQDSFSESADIKNNQIKHLEIKIIVSEIKTQRINSITE